MHTDREKRKRKIKTGDRASYPSSVIAEEKKQPEKA
jgi:hypothetical protein